MTLPSVDFTFKAPRQSVVLQALEGSEAVAYKTCGHSPPTEIMTSCTPLRPIVSTAAPPAQLAVPVKLSSDTGLFKFWQQETPAARLERDQRGFEALRRTNEQRQLAGERASAVAKAMIASNSAERVRKHRAAKLALRVASGFKPNQKRVSIAFACNHKDIYSQKFQKRMEEY